VAVGRSAAATGCFFACGLPAIGSEQARFEHNRPLRAGWPQHHHAWWRTPWIGHEPTGATGRTPWAPAVVRTWPFARR